MARAWPSACNSTSNADVWHASCSDTPLAAVEPSSMQNMMSHRNRILLMILATLGCGHASSSKPPAPTAATGHPSARVKPEQPPAPPISPEPSSDPETTDLEDHPEETLNAVMVNHFYIAGWARDTLVYGDLDALRDTLRSIVEYRLPQGAPAGLAELQEAARVTAQAENLSTAAVGVAAMARVCGDCHRKLAVVIEGKAHHIETVTPKQTDAISERMFRHGWAAQRLWEGLVAPSDSIWQAGAAALQHAPMRAPMMKAPAAPAFARELLHIRELGTRANAAWSMEERTDVYAELLATCANCHADNVVFGEHGDVAR